MNKNASKILILSVYRPSPYHCNGHFEIFQKAGKTIGADLYCSSFNEIEGFIFGEGYLYEILVEVVDVENPPADASSIEYILIEIVSKEEV